ncbi:MAG: ATP-binding cassette domain-containing protein [Bacteroidetes bacterium]|nr:ATP-binding cassette domain-containing protein [Bacteroidota bacterium]
MITLSNISKTFNKNQATAVLALSNVSLTINNKDYLVIVGSNGSGKSTLLNAIAGSFLVDEGSIVIDGNDVTKLQDYERAKWLSRVFQNPLQGTAPELSIIDNFRLAALRTQSKSITIGTSTNFINTIKDNIAILDMGLENKINQPVGSLSGGQRQALTLLMSVMDNSKILLLDEPTAALDPKSAATVMHTAQTLITQLQLTAILVTHNLKEATQYGNRIIQMQEGTIIKDVNATQKIQLQSTDVFGWF